MNSPTNIVNLIELQSGSFASPEYQYEWITLVCEECKEHHQVPKYGHEEDVVWLSCSHCIACDELGPYEEIPHYSELPPPYLDKSTLGGFSKFQERYNQSLFPVKDKSFLTNSNMKLERPIIFLDLETTGLKPTHDHIVQIGAIKLHPDGKREEKDVLIKPPISIPQETIEIHGITDEKVKDSPTFKQIAKAMLKWFSGCDIAGYNTDRFDIPFLCESFLRHGLTWDLSEVNLVDVLKVERMVNAHNLGDTYKRYFGKEMDGTAHDALDDTRATLEVFLQQCEKYSLPMVSELDDKLQGDSKRIDVAGYIVEKENVPAWSFGKHIGKDVRGDQSYCNWFLKSDFPTESKDCLNKLLRG